MFTFKPNEYFIDTELTKDYFLKCEPDEEDNALIFEGMLILLYCTNTSTTTTLYNFRSWSYWVSRMQNSLEEAQEPDIEAH